MHAVVETPSYLRAAKDVGMTDAEMRKAIDFIAEHPMAGNVIIGTGGCRKVRLARRGAGKSGGYRLITFFSGEDIPVFLVTVFGKNEKGDLSKSERNALAKMTATLVEEYRKKVVRLR